MIYYLFFSVNSMTYYAMNTINQSLAVIGRISEIFRMEEYENTRDLIVDHSKPVVEIIEGQYAWGFRISEQ